MAHIATHYTNAWGGEEAVHDETILSLLTSLGYNTSSEEALVKSAEKKSKPKILASVKVVKNEQTVEIELYIGKSIHATEFTWQLTTEQNQVISDAVPPHIIRDERDSGGALIFALPMDLPMGYHKLSIIRKKRKVPYEMTLIIAPKACYKQPAIEQDKKMWGPSVQLYTLRSQNNWGIGDFSDLKSLVSKIAQRGGDFVGLNPIHSLFPANPEEASPYSPSSRRWLNILYIDIPAVPEYALSNKAQQLVESNEFQARIEQARSCEWVDYSTVTELKMQVLPILFNTFKTNHLEKNSERARAFLNFVENGGKSLLAQATFDALHAHFSAENKNVWGWPRFPKKFQAFDKRAVQDYIKQNSDQINFYMYLQWLADTQIGEAQVLTQEKGMRVGLYRDLAVGVASSGCETWSDSDNLVTDVSIGAPPDVLGPQGQNWGLPPLNPQVLKETGYDAFIKLLRSNMPHCGALRIDHVLGLLRLWWIPQGKGATEGAYVYYPVEDMLAILALESHRHQCSIIGEDLGTVPEEITHLLQEAGIHSYKVFFFETSKTDSGYISPAHYPKQSMSAICTHDMPTLRSYWHCMDLELGKDLGLYPDNDQLAGLYTARIHNKQGVLDSVNGHGHLPNTIGRDALYVPMDSYLAEALQIHMAAGSSSLLSVQLEDWLEMDKPVNIPGTSTEYPNWRRKLSLNIEYMFNNEKINQVTSRLTETRAG